MSKLNRAFRSNANKAVTVIRSGCGKAVAGGAALLAPALAFATEPTDLGSTAVTAIEGAKSSVDNVQSAVIGIIVLFLIFSFIKRAMGR